MPPDSNARELRSAGLSRMPARGIVLLDRDGTINCPPHGTRYITSRDEVSLIPGAATGLRAMRDAGVQLMVVTNQSGVGRGLMTHAALVGVNARLRELLEAEGVHLDAIYSCTHAPSDGCSCRKPATGMADLALAGAGHSSGRVFVVGDDIVDIQLGRNIGAKTVLVRTGHGVEVERTGGHGADFVVDGLAQAAEIVVGLLDASMMPAAA